MDNQKISMPTEAEKQRAIARILDAGLPRRVAFGRELRAPARCCLAWGTVWPCPC